MRRGEIYWADLGDPQGSSPGFRRPVLVVQDDLLNDSALSTVMVVPLTSNTKRALAIGNVLLHAHQTSLEKDSVALVCQVMTADRRWLDERIGSLSRSTMRRVDDGLHLAIGLEPR